ncbi:MAG: hypothetical protein AB7E32_00060 [Desulfovibrio sp.]
MSIAVREAASDQDAAHGYRGEWIPLGLPWNQDFWERLQPLTLLRLNPHWNMEPGPGPAWNVEDVLVEQRFTAAPEISVDQGSWTARFPAAGLLLSARSRDDGANTELRWDYEQAAEGTGLLPAQAQSTVQYWLPSLREYYRLFESDGLKHRFWRLFMDKVMLTMNPTQRRICSFIFKFTLLELLLIFVLLVAYFKFFAK